MIAITAATLFTPEDRIDQPLLLVEDGIISQITTREHREIPSGRQLVDYADAILAPGFLDIHVHGASGHDVMEASEEAMPCIEHSLAKHGVSCYLPTTVTAPLETTIAALSRLADSIERSAKQIPGQLRARPIGIHLEGPFISHVRRGVHPVKNLTQPSLEIFDQFWQASRGHIRVMTIAPELDGAFEVIEKAVALGVCVSLGHSDASLKITRAAVDAGARHATHLFNAMRPLAHRDPGIVGEALINPRLSVEIIADGIHLDPAIVKLIVRAKGHDNVILITDGTAATGMLDGRYHLGTFEFDVKDGICLSEGKLAGSTLTMDRAIQNVMQFAGCDLQQAVVLATSNPGRVSGPLNNGQLHVGSAADIVVLSPVGEVRRTIIGGVGI